MDKKLTLNNKDIEKIKLGKSNNDFSRKLFKLGQSSAIISKEDVFYTGIIKGKSRKSYKNIFKNKKSKSKKEIEINIANIYKEKCINSDCHLCIFIRKILISLFKREKKYQIYKNYLLHCLTEIFILNKKMFFEYYNFSYYLMKREGPNRIRNRFIIRIDKLLNSEYERESLKEKESENDEFWKLFNFYENKKEGEHLSKNLLNFFNLGQIFDINIIKYIIDENEEYQECFNCLLFKGLSYINCVLILSSNKIYILSRVNISQNNILYDAYIPINKKFWILNNYEDILSEHCDYLNFYENKNINRKIKKKKYEKLDKGFWVYSFYYVEINEIHKRKYLHQNNAIEIFLKNGKNYYMAFNINKRDKLIKLIIDNIKSSHKAMSAKFESLNEIQENQKENIKYEIQNENLIKNENMIFIKDPIIFIENTKKYKINNYKKQKKLKINIGTIIDEKTFLEKSYEQWTIGNISTYSYLMLLNTLSGRTYNDLSQYHIFPWILSDFSSEKLDFNNPNIYRDLNYPIYAQSEEMREHLSLKYENFEEISEFKYHSGSHYSNAGFVCYYLIRVKPFSMINAEIQGEYFDVTDRLFSDIEKVAKLKEKYQELIPELFNMPEMYININKFEFGLNCEKKNINNVVLPLWGKHSPRIFCGILRKALESEYVSININNWIDLIFGYKQKGIHAEKSYNVLREVCTKFNPEKDCEDEKELEQKINEINEMGINPKQLFIKPHKKREKHKNIKAFFCKNIFLRYFKAQKDVIKLNNIENNDNIKEMRQYYEKNDKYISKGEGGLSSFRIFIEEDENNNEINSNNNNLIYFIITGKKVLIPSSYKNYIQWSNNNCFYIVKHFKKTKYKFKIQHMMKYKINCIKITKDGKFIIIGYNNGIIEKYKLSRINAPKIKLEQKKEKIEESIVNKEIKKDNKYNSFHENSNNKEGLFNVLFGNNNKNKRKSVNIQFYKNIFLF